MPEGRRGLRACGGSPSDAMAERARLETLDDVVARVMERTGPVRLLGLRGAARAVATAHLVRAHAERPVLVLVPTAKASDAFVADLRAALGEGDANGRGRGFPRPPPP